MYKRIQLISKLVENMGKPSFDEYLFRFFDELIGITQCTVFEFPKRGNPRMILAVGKGNECNKPVKTLAHEFVNGIFGKDKSFTELRDEKASSHPEWSLIEPKAIENTIYRQKYYDEPKLCQELALPYKDRQRTLVASIYRSTSQGEFSAVDEKTVSEYINLIIHLLARHVDFFLLNTSDDTQKREARYQQVFDILKNCNLTPREADICTLILLGHTTIGIGLKLDISTNTVATHRKRAYAKLGIATQNELFCRCFDALQNRQP